MGFCVMSALNVITTNNVINLLLPFIMHTHPSAFDLVLQDVLFTILEQGEAHQF
jgi:hypothetical protein